MEKEKFQKILNQVVETYERNKDCGEDDLSNFRMCEKMGVPAWKGLLVMMTEEMGRLMNAAKSENPDVEAEAVGEIMTELAAHAIMARILLGESPGSRPQEFTPRRGRRQGHRERKDQAVEPGDSQLENADAQKIQGESEGSTF